MGSLREGFFGPNRFYYATTTQKTFFVKKKPIFLGVMQAVFDYATLFFMVFGLLFLA